MAELASNIHIYDHEKARIYLENGREVKVNNHEKFSSDDAPELLTRIARRKGFISANDVIATFSA